MRRLRRAGVKVAAVLSGLVVALLAGELLVRTLGVRTDMPIGTLQVSSSVAGTLDRAHVDAFSTRPDVVRIAFLGDSFTYGLGVEPEETFVHKTGVLLNRRMGQRYATINLGRAGEDLIREWAVYDAARDTFRPHVVAQVIASNDLDVDLYEGMIPVQRLLEGRLGPSRFSKLCELVENKVRFSLAYRMGLDYARGGATPQEQERSWRIVSFALRETKRLIEESGAVYVLIHFPFLNDLTDYPLVGVHRRMAEVAQQMNVPYLDLLDAFRGQDSTKMCLPRDTHPSAYGHTVAAEAIAGFLAKEILPRLPSATTSRPARERPPDEIRSAAIQYFKRVLELDPSCRSARVSLETMQAR